VLREIQRMAMYDPAQLTDVKSPDDIKKLPEDVRRAIVGWSWDRNGKSSIPGGLTLSDVSDDDLAAIATGRGGIELLARRKARAGCWSSRSTPTRPTRLRRTTG
jgi:hypothetical protein